MSWLNFLRWAKSSILKATSGPGASGARARAKSKASGITSRNPEVKAAADAGDFNHMVNNMSVKELAKTAAVVVAADFATEGVRHLADSLTDGTVKKEDLEGIMVNGSKLLDIVMRAGSVDRSSVAPSTTLPNIYVARDGKETRSNDAELSFAEFDAYKHNIEDACRILGVSPRDLLKLHIILADIGRDSEGYYGVATRI